MEFKLNPSSIAKFMLLLIGILAVLHIGQLAIYYYVGDSDKFDFVRLLDFDYESNFPSLYSSSAILFCAVLLWVISACEKRNASTFRLHWRVLAIIFTFLGVDEGIGLHEEIGDFIESLELFDAGGYLYFAWVVPYGLLMIVFCLSYLKFVFSLPRFFTVRFIGAGFLFVFGAVGLETISAQEADLNGSETVYYSVLYTLEELCEMIAMVIFAYSLMRYMQDELGAVTLGLSDN